MSIFIWRPSSNWTLIGMIDNRLNMFFNFLCRWMWQMLSFSCWHCRWSKAISFNWRIFPNNRSWHFILQGNEEEEFSLFLFSLLFRQSITEENSTNNANFLLVEYFVHLRRIENKLAQGNHLSLDLLNRRCWWFVLRWSIDELCWRCLWQQSLQCLSTFQMSRIIKKKFCQLTCIDRSFAGRLTDVWCRT